MDDGRELNPDEQQELLQIARQTVESLCQNQTPLAPESRGGGLEFQRGAFVTLHKSGRLRGCIGNFTSEGPLADTVQSMAQAASTQDPRFPRVTQSELSEIDIEISVLSPLKEIQDVDEIQVGVHGIYLISPRGRGVLLPQVATEWGWDRDTFLDQTCVKAGMAPGCWKDPGTKILIFSAQIFGESGIEKA